MTVEYPKALYAKGWSDLSAYRRVHDAKEEEAAREEGFMTLPEFPHPDTFATPTFRLAKPGEVTDPKSAPQIAPAASAAAEILPEGWRDLAWQPLAALAKKHGAPAKGLNRDAAIAYLEAKSAPAGA